MVEQMQAAADTPASEETVPAVIKPGNTFSGEEAWLLFAKVSIINDTVNVT